MKRTNIYLAICNPLLWDKTTCQPLHGEKHSRYEQVSWMTSENKHSMYIPAGPGQSLTFPLLFDIAVAQMTLENVMDQRILQIIGTQE